MNRHIRTAASICFGPLLVVAACSSNAQETSPVKTDAQEEVVQMSDDELRNQLTPLQYQVTQECGTERAFQNEYWDNKRAGIYVDVVSGEPLFASLHKYDSGSGWPSFTQPLVDDNIVEKRDRTWIMERTEVTSTGAGSHLGHVFEDGPGPTGLRYCVNSASLRFIPVEALTDEGYKEFLPLFENNSSEDTR